MKVTLLAIIIFLPGVAALSEDLQIFLQRSLHAEEGENVTLACYFSPRPTLTNRILIKWTMLPTWDTFTLSSDHIKKIYNSEYGNFHPGVVEFVGDTAKGDCSIRLLNVSRSLGPVFKFELLCRGCSSGTIWKYKEAMLSVRAPAPARHSHGGTSGTTVAPEGETSTTPVADWWMTVLGTMLVMGVILGLGAVIVTCIQLPQPSGSSPHSRSGDAQADVHVGVEENGHLLI